MVKNHKLSKSINDVSWGILVDMIDYKAKWNNKLIVKINRFFPSSKTCNCCGWINQGLTLKDRVWTCDKCGTVYDRDHNASKNILKEGLKITSVGTTDYEHGAKIRPDLLGTSREVFKDRIFTILKPLRI